MNRYGIPRKFHSDLAGSLLHLSGRARLSRSLPQCA